MRVLKSKNKRHVLGERISDWGNDRSREPQFYLEPKDTCFEETARLSRFQVREMFGQKMVSDIRQGKRLEI